MDRNLGAEVTTAELEQSLEEIQVLRRWFAEQVLHTNSSTASSAILLLPVGSGHPVRKDNFVVTQPRLRIDALNFGAILGLPQFIIPSK